MRAASRAWICAAALAGATLALDVVSRASGDGAGVGEPRQQYGGVAFAQSSSSGPPSIARAYFDEARLRADVGDWQGAASLVAEAEQSDPRDSDVRYLSALAALRNGAYPGICIAELDAAIAAARFRYYNARDALSLKAELLVRSGRFLEALEALRGIPLDADARWIRCRAFLGADDRSSFDKEVAASLAAFPGDARFARVFLERYGMDSGSFAPTQGERSLIDTILSRLGGLAEEDPELPVLASPLLADRAARRDSVLAYRASGGKSARATLLALDYGIIDEKAACAELFSGVYPLSLADLRRALDLARSDEDRAAVGTALDSYSGPLTIGDGKGMHESAQLRSGRAIQWTRSYDDERGHVSYAATLVDEVPTSLDVSRPEGELRVSYGSYPSCTSISIRQDSRSTEYRFAPGALSYAPLKPQLLLGQGAGQRFIPIATIAQPPTETACAAAALSIAVTSGDGQERQTTSMENGIPQRRETWKAGRLYSVLQYDRGRPSVERVDEDGDGRYETERLYGSDASGNPAVVWVRIDTKGSGIFDYREQLVPPYRKEWDFDDDGSIDAVQLTEPDGSLLRQFSSRLDGRFDESMRIVKGKIVSLTRGDRSPALIADRNPNVTWIGMKPFDLGSNVPAGEGVFTVMNKRIRIVRVGAQAFAEIVP